MQTRFMAWEDNRLVSLIDVTADPKVHEIIEIPENPDDGLELSYEVAAGTKPYLETEFYSQSYRKRPTERPLGLFNFFKGVQPLPVTDVRTRLMRMHRILKTIWYIQAPGDCINLKTADNGNNDQSRFEDTYSKLFRVDHVSDPERFWVEMPFSFIMWRKIEIIECLCASNTLQAEAAAMSLPFTKDIAQRMSLNILPNCQTILHSITRNYTFLKYFLKYTGFDDEDDPFVVPFIENLSGETALHLSTEGDTADSRSTEYLLTELLPGMPLDHHGRAVADVIPKLVAQELPYLGQYLDKRLIATKQLKKVCRQDKMTIKEKRGETGDEKQFVAVADLWPDERLVIDRCLEESPNGEELEIKFLDLPKLHQPYE